MHIISWSFYLSCRNCHFLLVFTLFVVFFPYLFCIVGLFLFEKESHFPFSCSLSMILSMFFESMVANYQAWELSSHVAETTIAYAITRAYWVSNFLKYGWVSRLPVCLHACAPRGQKRTLMLEP